MVFRSPRPDVAVPMISLPELILERARRHGGRTALIDGASGWSCTFDELAGRVRRTAAGLAALGLEKNDVVALLHPNCPDYATMFLAVGLLGGVNTPINPNATAAEIAAQAEDSGARILFTAPGLLEKIHRPSWRRIVVRGEAPGAIPLDRLLESPDACPKIAIDPSRDAAVLPYSSGTTGVSKGVQLTHRNLVANLMQTAEGIFDGADTIVGLPPFFHIYGLMVVLHLGLHLGATDVILPRFHLGQFVDAIERYGVTHANLAPPLILALAKHPALDPRRLASLRTVQSGAAPLGREVAEAFAARFGCRVLQGYGLTEASPVTHLAPRSTFHIPVESIGPPVPNTECRILDLATGAELGPGQAGELYIRGPQVMRGYLHAPEKTAEMIDPEGWLRTGDIARADAHGNFYIVDRAKELIKYKAYAIAPAELEALLLSHPQVADAAVIPSPDEAAGEVPKAYVVAAAPLDAGELMAWVAERVAPHKKVRRVAFVDQIPKSASGKILRRVLIEQERALAAGSPP